MVRSMTGFGRGEAQNDQIRFVVEIKSVNHRYLEPSIRLSRRFAILEGDIRNALTQALVRGKADVSVTFEEIQSSCRVKVNEDVLSQYLEALRGAGKKYGLEDDLRLSQLLAFPEVVETTVEEADADAVRPVLLEAMARALEVHREMRSREGERIGNDLLEKADYLLSIVEKLKEDAPRVEDQYRIRLTERVRDLLERMENGFAPDPGLMENEIALYADRVCIDEELVRLTSHIEELKKLLSSSEPVGRQLDFLLQEFNREANTIASKAGSLEVTQNALLLKKEIEKVREQIQNLE